MSYIFIPFINFFFGQNYGAFFDTFNVGVTGVQIIAGSDGSSVTNLSTNPWVYKIGLLGETKRVYEVSDLSETYRWNKELLSTNQQFIWYKVQFSCINFITSRIITFSCHTRNKFF